MPFAVLFNRKLKHFLRLEYPLTVILSDDGRYRGEYLDLPGCEACAERPADLYATLERMRREWIRRRLSENRTVPFPNDHLKHGDTGTYRRAS
ncbi:MAG: hypothetical protein AAF605_05450 [Myxococcota bacterium]